MAIASMINPNQDNVLQSDEQLPDDQQLPPQPEQEEPEEDKFALKKIPAKLRKFMESNNCCEFLTEDELYKIGYSVKQGKDIDESSRIEWNNQLKEALKIAKQVGDLDTNVNEKKTIPFEGASNVKYPLMMNACIQFNARVNPEITQKDRVVYVDVMTRDKDGTMEERALRLGAHMSYQLLGKNDHWRSDTDKMLMVLPMVGTVFRKSYWNDVKKMPDADLCLPEDVIINNKAKNVNSAFRITHKIYLTDNDLIERMRAGIYCDIDLSELGSQTSDDVSEDMENGDDAYATKRTYTLLEQHTYLDLDGDGYKEPYVVVIHEQSMKVLRIVARYDEDSIVLNDSNKLVRIEPIQYFTDYHFMPSPDGTFYSLGFATILYPLNLTINKSINSLMDSAEIANCGGGFIGKGIRMRKEALRFTKGEFKFIENQSGVALKDNIIPLPTPNISPVMLQLIELMIKSAQETASISDVMQGQQPSANTPATTVLSLLEQGTKIFSAVLYRLYASFKKEFEKLYQLNKKYLEQEEYFKSAVAKGMISPDDYAADDFGIFPIADPSESTDAQRLTKAQAILGMMGKPGVNNYEVMRRWFEALRVTNIDKLLSPPDPNAPPPPEELKIMAETGKINMERADKMMSSELRAIEVELAQRRLQLDAEKAAGELASKRIDDEIKIATFIATSGIAPLQQARGIENQEMSIAQQEIPDNTKDIEQHLDQLVGSGQQQGQPPQQGQPQEQQPEQTQAPIEEQATQDSMSPEEEGGQGAQESPNTSGVSGLSAQQEGIVNSKMQQVQQAGEQ